MQDSPGPISYLSMRLLILERGLTRYGEDANTEEGKEDCQLHKLERSSPATADMVCLYFELKDILFISPCVCLTLPDDFSLLASSASWHLAKALDSMSTAVQHRRCC